MKNLNRFSAYPSPSPCCPLPPTSVSWVSSNPAKFPSSSPQTSHLVASVRDSVSSNRLPFPLSSRLRQSEFSCWASPPKPFGLHFRSFGLASLRPLQPLNLCRLRLPQALRVIPQRSAAAVNRVSARNQTAIRQRVREGFAANVTFAAASGFEGGECDALPSAVELIHGLSEHVSMVGDNWELIRRIHALIDVFKL